MRAQLAAAQERAAFLAEASALLTASLDWQTTLQSVARLAVPRFAGTCLIDIVEDDELRRVVIACADPARKDLLQELEQRWPSTRFSQEVMRSGRPYTQLEVLPDLFTKLAQGPEHLALLHRLDTRSFMVLPLLARDRTLGAITFASYGAGGRYGEADVALAEELARRAAHAVDNARLFAEAQDAEARSQFLAEASRELSSSLDYPTTLRKVATLAVPRLADWCIIDVVDEAGSVHRMAVAHRDPAKAALAREIEERPSAALSSPSRLTRVLQTGRSAFYPHVQEPEPVAPVEGDFRIRLLQAVRPVSVLIVPLAARGRVIGAVTCMMAESGRRYRPSDLTLAEDLAQRAALAVDNARLYREAQEAERRSAFLAEASRLLASSLDVESTFARLANLVVPSMADWCVIDVLERDLTVRRVAVAHADPTRAATAEKFRRLPLEEHYLVRIPEFVRLGESLLASHVPREAVRAWSRSKPQRAVLEEIGPESAILVPLVVTDHVLGSIILFSTDPRRRFGPRDLALCEELARRAAVALDQGRLHREVQQARAEADEANRAKDEFLATLSHELRSPLSAVLTWAHLLRQGVLDEAKSARAVETIEQNARLQVRLIEDLLDVSRIVSGKLTLRLGRVELNGIIQAATEIFRGAAEAKRIELAVRLEPVPPVRGDPARLQQVVGNLVSNAIKFTPEGGRVTIELGAHETAVEVRVRDTGIGIPAPLLPYVFDRFRQADSSTTRRHGGLGLGLAIARHLVLLHGGEIEAESAGQHLGATFRVTLPVDTAAPELARPRRPWPQDLPSLRGLRVLVVDDQAEAREFVSAVLTMCGADVTPATSTRRALEALEGMRADLLVADLAMPGEDGYDLIRQVRRLEGARLPAIALTALASAEDRDRALAAGFDLHLAKPAEPFELVGAVARLAAR